ncbi:sensor histidine kinase [Carboxylicivirga sp. N1Y90]|uniref:sensor histidine kinase n=1 Tax=Carboxylicivirga fragile TaxID=3417571 RepID=UPI003D351346|nr:histidine kinase [Marinilabiliaceae bacterium N1Y90]
MIKSETSGYSSKKLFTKALVSTLYGVLAFSYLSYSELGTLPQFTNQLDTLSLFVITSWFVFALFSLITKQLNTYKPWLSGMVLRFTLQFLLNSLVAFGVLLISLKAFVYIKFPDKELLTYISEQWDITLKFIILFEISNLVYILINLYQYSFTSFTQANIESEQMIRERLKLQYEILKSQLSPHYLFNTLNTIASLLHRDIATTEGFVRKFAQTFNYIIESHQKDLVSVEEELKFIEAYYYLLRIRFENALEISIDLNAAHKTSFIPPMTFQLLVENAVKHNQFSEEKPLKIIIESDKAQMISVSNNFERKMGFIEVENQMVKKPVEHVSHKIGLENIKKRYAYFTNKELNISRNHSFVVQLPIISKAI